MNLDKSPDNYSTSTFNTLFSSSKALINGEICSFYINNLWKGEWELSNKISFVYKSMPFSYLIYWNLSDNFSSVNLFNLLKKHKKILKKNLMKIFFLKKIKNCKFYKGHFVLKSLYIIHDHIYHIYRILSN